MAPSPASRDKDARDDLAAVLDYRLQKDIFPAWALALAARHPGT